MSIGPNGGPDVEVRPEVVFLFELLRELSTGALRIPRFQRPFVWRRDQMTDLLDSVYKQYPIGSLLVWETDSDVATLDRIGPFVFKGTDQDRRVGYLLDGHQRLSTLAGALVSREEGVIDPAEEDPDRWNVVWDLETRKFQHVSYYRQRDGNTFPLTSLLDTIGFLNSVEQLRSKFSTQPDLGGKYVRDVSNVARAFQSYRVPVIRIKNTGISEAVEIFARLNSKGHPMSADQMVSALMYRQAPGGEPFNLAAQIDVMESLLGEQHFDIDRTIILRCILANLDEDIYNTDWTRLAAEKREDLLVKLRNSVDRTSVSLNRAINFLQSMDVRTSRLLPYSMQLVVLSAFFDRRPDPSHWQEALLRRWFWVSSFSGWFGGANPSRVNGLVAEFRNKIAPSVRARALESFNLSAESLPYPTSFDMRSARTRALLLVMLSLRPMGGPDMLRENVWRLVSELGPEAVGKILPNVPAEFIRDPANRITRVDESVRGSYKQWVLKMYVQKSWSVLESHAISRECAAALSDGDDRQFLQLRQDALIRAEVNFQAKAEVTASAARIGSSPIDTD